MDYSDMSDGEITPDGEVCPGTSVPAISVDESCADIIDISLEVANKLHINHEPVGFTRTRSMARETKLGSYAIGRPDQRHLQSRARPSVNRRGWRGKRGGYRSSWDNSFEHNSAQLIYDEPSRYEVRGDGQVKKIGHGESYRPSTRPRSPDTRYGRDRSRSPPRRDRVRTPPRERARTPVVDTYQPNARNRSPRRRSRSPIRRSRSPPFRGRDRSPGRDVSNWRPRERVKTPQRNRTPPRAKTPPRTRTPARARSPVRARSPMRTRSPPRMRSPRARTPQRRFSPRRDVDRRQRPRSPRRDEPAARDSRRRSKSPYDSRPIQRRSPRPARRSPPRVQRGNGPPGSRSPPRRFPNGPTSLTWRRRSPSPAPVADRSSGRTSASNSHISSPTAQLSRLTVGPRTHDDRTNTNSPITFDRSPLPFRETPLVSRERSPVRTTKTEEPRSPKPRSPPRGPAAWAPTGPSAARTFTGPITSPTVSNSSAPGSATIHNKLEISTSTVPPAGPRGYNPASRGSAHPRGGRGGSFSDRRSDSGASWGGAPPTPTVTSASPTISSASPSSNGIPTGPRAASGGTSDWFTKSWATAAVRPPGHSVPNPAPYQRVQQPRLHPAMSNLPQIIPGGRKDPSALGIPKDLEARLKKNEEETERLREDLRIKEEKLRNGLRTWDKLERDSKSMGLKAELSERHVRILAGEGVGGAAF